MSPGSSPRLASRLAESLVPLLRNVNSHGPRLASAAPDTDVAAASEAEAAVGTQCSASAGEPATSPPTLPPEPPTPPPELPAAPVQVTLPATRLHASGAPRDPAVVRAAPRRR